jgi:NAD(P)-dependent dehydrogenase (short-subunit alcohol dehydrogenase family)
MGHFAALELARGGEHILAVGRKPERGAATVEAIRGIAESAEFLCADMGDAADVHALAMAVVKALDIGEFMRPKPGPFAERQLPTWQRSDAQLPGRQHSP